MSEREARLPKWAQQELSTLRMHLREAYDDLDKAKPTRITTGFTHLVDRPPVYVDDSGYLQLWTMEQDVAEGLAHMSIRWNPKEGRLDVRSPAGSLSIHPQVTNVVSIEVVQR